MRYWHPYSGLTSDLTILPALVVNEQRADHRPLSRGTPQEVPRENAVVQQQPLGHGQVGAPGQFFSRSSTAASMAAACMVSGATGTTLPTA